MTICPLSCGYTFSLFEMMHSLLLDRYRVTGKDRCIASSERSGFRLCRENALYVGKIR